MSQILSIVPISNNYRVLVDTLIAESWSGPFIAVHGVLFDTRTQPGFVAVEDGAVAGYILYDLSDSNCEITVLESVIRGRGIGKALIDTVVDIAKQAACRRIWLVTTNDNTNAIRFYQRFGFNLQCVHINAVDKARGLKPQIPLTGCDNIPIKHEFVFEIILDND